ncbi:hypothetical protein ACHABQ_03490 [Nesterenkonia aurantiaca]|uniref:hypothetical protein n=1 Tax=Nesterenkonia aurantiaca TaxID=1436010 RepID=UPI003EE466F8
MAREFCCLGVFVACFTHVFEDESGLGNAVTWVTVQPVDLGNDFITRADLAI